MTSGGLSYEIFDQVALLRLNRPAVLNALDPALLNALIEAVERVRTDPNLRSVVVAGAGRAFCAGGDLTAMLDMDRASFREYIGLLQRLSWSVRALPKPVIAALQGYVLAGGFELAVICDIRIAAEDAVFGLPDTPIGLSPTSGLTSLLPQIVGMGWAKYLTLTGDRFDVHQAERIGLVTRVVARADLEQEALALARKLGGYPPLGLRYIKQGFAMAADTDLQTALTHEADAEVSCFDTEDVRSNLRKFAGGKHSWVNAAHRQER
jgi:methylglutaconyl-CoA hydratase